MRLADILLGRPLASDEEGEQRVGVWAGIPMLGLDGLGSAAYGPEAALTLLIPLGAAGVGYIGPISGLIVALLAIVAHVPGSVASIAFGPRVCCDHLAT